MTQWNAETRARLMIRTLWMFFVGFATGALAYGVFLLSLIKGHCS